MSSRRLKKLADISVISAQSSEHRKKNIPIGRGLAINLATSLRWVFLSVLISISSSLKRDLPVCSNAEHWLTQITLQSWHPQFDLYYPMTVGMSPGLTQTSGNDGFLIKPFFWVKKSFLRCFLRESREYALLNLFNLNHLSKKEAPLTLIRPRNVHQESVRFEKIRIVSSKRRVNIFLHYLHVNI